MKLSIQPSRRYSRLLPVLSAANPTPTDSASISLP
jgi:hypothetical protein